MANAVIRGPTRLIGLAVMTVTAMWLLPRLFSPSSSGTGEEPFPDDAVAPTDNSDALSKSADAISMKLYHFPETPTDPRENF